MELEQFKRGFEADAYWFKGYRCCFEPRFTMLYVWVSWGLLVPMTTEVYPWDPIHRERGELLQRFEGERVEAREALRRMGYEWARNGPNVLLPSEALFRQSWPAYEIEVECPQ